MNIGSKTALVVSAYLLVACTAPQKVALPPEIVKVPEYMPLPSECGLPPLVHLPVGSNAADVMDQLRDTLNAAQDQIIRCFGASNAN